MTCPRAGRRPTPLHTVSEQGTASASDVPRRIVNRLAPAPAVRVRQASNRLVGLNLNVKRARSWNHHRVVSGHLQHIMHPRACKRSRSGGWHHTRHHHPVTYWIPASKTRSRMAAAHAGLVDMARLEGTHALAHRGRSCTTPWGHKVPGLKTCVHAWWRTSKNTPNWQFSLCPTVPEYYRATPAEAVPFFRDPFSSVARIPTRSPRCLPTYPINASRIASRSQSVVHNKHCIPSGVAWPARSDKVQDFCVLHSKNSP